MSNLRPQAYSVTLASIPADYSAMVQFPPVDNAMGYEILPRSGATVYFMGTTFPAAVTLGFGIPTTGLKIDGNARFWLGAEGGASTGLVDIIQYRSEK